MKHLYTSFFTILLTLLSFLPAPALADVDYFTITAEEANVTVKITYAGSGTTFQTDKITVDYSTDDGVTWSTQSNIQTWSITLTNIGDKLLIRGNNSKGFNTTANKNARYNAFQFDKKVSLSGNIMSLIDKTAETVTIPAYCFFRAFRSQTKIIDISGLKLPAKALSTGCYQGLFDGCTGITGDTPDLSAIESVDESSCQEMFRSCMITRIIGFPQLDVVGKNSFQSAFIGCSELITAPELTATVIGVGSYAYMFSGCSKLEKAPKVLPATTLFNACYREMFKNCTKLEGAPVIKGTTFPNSNSTASNGCMAGMFSGCTTLNYLKVYFTGWDNNSTANLQATYDWMYNTPKNPTCTFYCPYNFVSPTASRGANRVQTNWTIKYFYTYTFDTNGGTWDGSDDAALTIDRVSDETLSELPEAQKTGYRFTGWNTAADGTGDAITLDNQTDFTTDATFYAQYEKIPAYTFNVAATGGTWDGTDADSRVLYAELPDDTPQKEGNNFTGWNTATDGTGDAITADNISSFTADATFYAQWQPQLIELDDTQDNTALLASLNGVSCDVLLAGRTLVGGCVNTLCLPFSLTDEELAESPLAGCTIWQFNSSAFNGETLSIDVSEVASITAGVPYLVEPATAVSDLRFNGVTISTSTASTCGNSSVRFVGLLSPFTLTAGSEDQLFVGAGNKLLRPSTSSALRGFRAWFRLNDGQALAAPRAKLTFGEKPQLPTAIDGTYNDNTPRKVFINGQLYITSDGTTYTPAGNIMPK